MLTLEKKRFICEKLEKIVVGRYLYNNARLETISSIYVAAEDENIKIFTQEKHRYDIQVILKGTQLFGSLRFMQPENLVNFLRNNREIAKEEYTNVYLDYIYDLLVDFDIDAKVELTAKPTSNVVYTYSVKQNRKGNLVTAGDKARYAKASEEGIRAVNSLSESDVNWLVEHIKRVRATVQPSDIRDFYSVFGRDAVCRETKVDRWGSSYTMTLTSTVGVPQVLKTLRNMDDELALKGENIHQSGFVKEFIKRYGLDAGINFGYSKGKRAYTNIVLSDYIKEVRAEQEEKAKKAESEKDKTYEEYIEEVEQEDKAKLQELQDLLADLEEQEEDINNEIRLLREQRQEVCDKIEEAKRKIKIIKKYLD